MVELSFVSSIARLDMVNNSGALTLVEEVRTRWIN